MQRFLGKKFVIVISLIVFMMTSAVGSAYASPVHLPLPGEVSPSSPFYAPVLLKGLTIDAQNPLAFRFVADAADTGFEGQVLQEETDRLVRYFITSLAIPESDMWVNLSPLEKDRIIPEMFGKTEMGRDLLAQDYILKQVTAGLLNPENETGKKFWDKVYESTDSSDHSTQEAIESFNKVWIVPDQANVFQNGNSVFVGDAKLKVMMEEDYEARKANSQNEATEISTVKDAFRDIIIPAIEREVNEGENFALLRQVYNAMLLAVWYKKVLKESVLASVFVDRQNIKGIDAVERDAIESIYERYVDAFQKGAASVIAERYDPVSGQIVPQMYFSGGAIGYNQAQLDATSLEKTMPYFSENTFDVSVNFAQMADEDRFKDIDKFKADEIAAGNQVIVNKDNVEVVHPGSGQSGIFEIKNDKDVDLDSLRVVSSFNSEGNAAMLEDGEELAVTNGGIDLKDASDLFNVSSAGTMVFPRMKDFSKAQFNFENVSPRIGSAVPLARPELNRMLGVSR